MRREGSPTLLGMLTLMQFPDVAGENLAGQVLSFPRDFGGARTIALVAFDLKQRADLETWVPFIDRFARGGTARGRLFPTLPRSMRIMKRMIVATMRKGAPTIEAREATVPLFVDVDEFCQQLDIADRSNIHAFVVESDGSISEHRVGPYTAVAGAAIEALLVRATA
jgi:hypothetical protein